MPGKLLKMALLTILPMAAGFRFGIICRRMGFAHQLFVAPFHELLRLMLWLLLSLILVAVVVGMVAVLFRPQWPAFVAFGLSGVALLFGWGLTLRNIALSSLYVLAGVVYTVLTRRDLRQRISFSARPVAIGVSLPLCYSCWRSPASTLTSVRMCETRGSRSPRSRWMTLLLILL